jgi:hypothetical protein
MLASLAWSQEVKEANRTVYTYDANGRRTPAYDQASVTGPGGSSQSQTITDFNGRRVPLEAAEETVISESAEGRVVERLVKKFDSQGRPTGQEKVRIEETKAGDGSTTVRSTVYDRDLNGHFAVRERSTTMTQKDASSTRAETVVERLNVNGNFDPQERKVAVTTGDDNQSLKDVTVYRKDQGGALTPVVREVTEITREGDREVANTSEYNTAASGQMQLTGQKLSQTVKNADGSQSQVIDVFGAGQHREPKLRERQLIERSAGPDNGTVETFSIQRPAVDSGRLGPPQKISETVCEGNCKP